MHFIDVSSYDHLFFFLDYIHRNITMSSKPCKCGGTEIYTNCAEVIEELSIVNEPELTDTRGGGIQVIGTFVGEDDIRGPSTGGMMGFNARESRQITLQKARRGIMDIASNMRMNQDCVKAAFQVCYKENKFFIFI
jgi:hypothetical protein